MLNENKKILKTSKIVLTKDIESKRFPELSKNNISCDEKLI